MMIEIARGLFIPEEEIEFGASRSGGPGGQNVNKVNSRVTLRFHVEGSPSLTPDQKRIIRSRLGNRIGKDGFLSVVSQRFRSQGANRNAALERFCELIEDALKVVPPRERRPASAGPRTNGASRTNEDEAASNRPAPEGSIRRSRNYFQKIRRIINIRI